MGVSMFAAAALLCAMAPQPEPPRFLVLAVGIDAYQEARTGFPPLHGRSDALAFVAALGQYFGVGRGRDQVVTLATPGQTTRAAILDAFGKLVDDAQPQDAVVFFFSGHGTQVPDATKATGYAQAIVPIDVRRRPDGEVVRESVIAGPDIRKLLDRLAAKGATNVTLIFDSCTSENITRGALLAKSGVPNSAPPARPSANAKAPGGWNIQNALAAFSAAEEGMPAWEDTGQKMGLFTLAVIDAMRRFSTLRTGADVTYSTFFDSVWADVRYRARAMDRPQVPSFEGNRERVLFGAETLPQPAYFRTYWQGGELRVDAGLIHGVREGFVFGLYPETGDLEGDPAFRLPARQPTPSDSALVLATASRPPEGSRWRAVLIDGQPTGRVRVLAVGPKLPKGLEHPVVEKVTDGSYDLRLSPVPNAGDWVLVDLAGNVALRFKDSDTDALTRVLTRWAKRKAIDELAPSGPAAAPIEIEAVQVTTTGPKGNEQIVSMSGVAGASLDLRTQPNQPNLKRFDQRFCLRVRAPKSEGSEASAPYLTVLDLTANATVKQLWPFPVDGGFTTDDKARFRLRADGRWRYLGRANDMILPSNDAPSTAEMGRIAAFDVDGKQDGVGFEVLKAIATDRYEEFTPLLTEGVRRGARGETNALTRLIDAFAASQPVTRGAPPGVRPALWSVARANLFVDVPRGRR